MFVLFRRIGALAILATGAIHLQQLLVQNFQAIPVIRVLFVLNVIGSCGVGLALLAPLDRMRGSRRADAAVPMLCALGLTIAIGSLVGLYISENGGLFGLDATHLSTAAVLAIFAEGVAVLTLTPVLVKTASTARRCRTGNGGSSRKPRETGRPAVR